MSPLQNKRTHSLTYSQTHRRGMYSQRGAGVIRDRDDEGEGTGVGSVGRC